MTDIACLYCLQPLKDMGDPRQLPCSHIFCLDCLKAECGSLLRHECRICREVYEPVDFNSLPPPNIVPSADDGPVDNLFTAAAKLKCDKCTNKEHKKPAVRYCIDCGVKTCIRHNELHDGFFEDESHETVEIMEYAANPSQYKRAMTCVHHQKTITMACANCYTYNCLTCDTKDVSGLCAGMQRKHTYQSLDKIDKDIKAMFDGLLKKSDQKKVDIDNKEKDALNKMDQLMADCEAMIANVDRKTEEQIEFIRTHSANLKERINRYQEEKTEQVIGFVRQLRQKKELIEEARMATHRFLQDIHVMDLIKEKEERSRIITEANNIDLGTCTWINQRLRIGDKRQMEVDLGNEGAIVKPYGYSNNPLFYPQSYGWSK